MWFGPGEPARRCSQIARYSESLIRRIKNVLIAHGYVPARALCVWDLRPDSFLKALSGSRRSRSPGCKQDLSSF